MDLSSLWPGYEARETDGRIRNGSRNLIKEFFNGDELSVVVKLYNGHRTIAAVKELVVMTFHGHAPRFNCPVCGGGWWIRHRVVNLNGVPGDCSPANLKYVPDRGAERQHELECLELAMQHNEVPPYGWTVSPRAMQAHRQKILFS